MADPQRHEPASLLHNEGIPCVVWFEDAIGHYGVPTVAFGLYLLVPDIDAATQVLVEHGWANADTQSAEYHFLSRHADIPRRRLTSPGGAEPTVLEPTPWPPLPPSNEKPRPPITVLLSAKDWRYPAEKLASSLINGFFPKLNHLLDSLISSLLDWNDYPRGERHVSVQIGYLYAYVAEVKQMAIADSLKFKNRQFHNDVISGLEAGTCKFTNHERRVRAELRAGRRELETWSLERTPENAEYFSGYLPPSLRRPAKVQPVEEHPLGIPPVVWVGVSLAVLLGSFLCAKYCTWFRVS